jgi:hypothetical protein
VERGAESSFKKNMDGGEVNEKPRLVKPGRGKKNLF